MRALVYDGPREVRVKDVPDARIERPTDVLVKITTTNICGSDLHMYEGRAGMEMGRTSFPPVGTPPSWRVCSRGTPSSSTATGRWG